MSLTVNLKCAQYAPIAIQFCFRRFHTHFWFKMKLYFLLSGCFHCTEPVSVNGECTPCLLCRIRTCVYHIPYGRRRPAGIFLGTTYVHRYFRLDTSVLPRKLRSTLPASKSSIEGGDAPENHRTGH